jgi:saccharopine dehydrogenase-like NADP-dependent oxidoreductase
MKIAIFGYGIIGQAIKKLLDDSSLMRDLSHSEDRLIVRAYDIAEKPGCIRIDSVEEVVPNNDLVICSAPYQVNAKVAQCCLDYNRHYLDLTEDIKSTSSLRTLLNPEIDMMSHRVTRDTSERVCIPQCGLAPGAVNIIAHHLASQLDSVDTMEIRVGALPKYPTNMMKYHFTWSPEGVINEYSNRCEAIVNGERLWLMPLEGYETLSLNGKDFEAFNTSGGVGTLVDTWESRVQNLNYKSLRYMGHHHLMKFLLNDLDMAHKRKEIGDLLKHSMPPYTLPDVVHILIKVSGQKDNQSRMEIYQKSIESHNGLSAIQLTTASSVCSWIYNLVTQKVKGSGFIKQEDLDYNLFISNEFGKIYADTPYNS